MTESRFAYPISCNAVVMKGRGNYLRRSHFSSNRIGAYLPEIS